MPGKHDAQKRPQRRNVATTPVVTAGAGQGSIWRVQRLSRPVTNPGTPRRHEASISSSSFEMIEDAFDRCPVAILSGDGFSRRPARPGRPAADFEEMFALTPEPRSLRATGRSVARCREPNDRADRGLPSGHPDRRQQRDDHAAGEIERSWHVVCSRKIVVFRSAKIVLSRSERTTKLLTGESHDTHSCLPCSSP